MMLIDFEPFWFLLYIEDAFLQPLPHKPRVLGSQGNFLISYQGSAEGFIIFNVDDSEFYKGLSDPKYHFECMHGNNIWDQEELTKYINSIPDEYMYELNYQTGNYFIYLMKQFPNLIANNVDEIQQYLKILGIKSSLKALGQRVYLRESVGSDSQERVTKLNWSDYMAVYGLLREASLEYALEKVPVLEIKESDSEASNTTKA